MNCIELAQGRVP